MTFLKLASPSAVRTTSAPPSQRLLVSGNEAVALAALHQGFAIGTGYPGTPSTEILESLASLGSSAQRAVRTQWAPNEKVALEVGIGAAFAGARALVTMKHVGVNVAADALFTAAYTELPGALVLVAADDPGMASSQNEQDSRRYAIAAAIPVLEPTDAQEAYDFLALAVQIGERWHLPVMLRMTTRVCHAKSVVMTRPSQLPQTQPRYERDFAGRVMLPGNARRAHPRLREKLAEIAEWGESAEHNRWIAGTSGLGVICSGVTANHVREVVPDASLLVVGMCHPAPVEKMREFSRSVTQAIVIDEGDPILFESARSAGIEVASRPESYRFGELNVERVRELLTGEPAPKSPTGLSRPPALCLGCPHRTIFGVLSRHDLIVSGDIGCYTLAALPPLSAIDTVVCMGASIGVGLGLRHVLDEHESRKVVSVIGDGTFVHSGLTGLVEMVYNPPENGHVVIILDNGTTAMTGLQEHPATGRSLQHKPTARLSIEGVARALGVTHVAVIDPCADEARFERTLLDMLDSKELCVLVARRPCVLAANRLHQERLTATSASAESLPLQAEGEQ
jgi:indolepyruvate ferredoxin oxidoreductase alpha subunit